MLPPLLAKELEVLREQYSVEVQEEDSYINIMIANFPTGPLYNTSTTLLLLRIPRAYPDAGMDMFWTDPNLRLATGAIPQCGELIEQYVGREWRRFSWHHNNWSPTLQSLSAYLDFVKRRFHAP